MPDKKHLLELNYIYLLSGGMIKDPETGKWRTTRFNDAGDQFGALGDYIRVIAAKCVYTLNPGVKIITSSGKGQMRRVPDAPKFSDLLKRELVDLGVPAKAITEKGESHNTHEGLKVLARFLEKKKNQKVAILSNRYHFPRIHAMIEANPELKKSLVSDNVIYLSAEAVVIQFDPNEPWESIIHDAYQTPAMKQRMEMEAKGVEDIKAGRYQFSQ